MLKRLLSERLRLIALAEVSQLLPVDSEAKARALLSHFLDRRRQHGYFDLEWISAASIIHYGIEMRTVSRHDGTRTGRYPSLFPKDVKEMPEPVDLSVFESLAIAGRLFARENTFGQREFRLPSLLEEVAIASS